MKPTYEQRQEFINLFIQLNGYVPTEQHLNDFFEIEECEDRLNVIEQKLNKLLEVAFDLEKDFRRFVIFSSKKSNKNFIE